MEIKAFSLGGEPSCYFTCLPVIDILDRMEVDEWSVDNIFGYQRAIDLRRFGKGNLSITKLIENGISAATNLVINTREKLVFQEDFRQGAVISGFLDIPDHVRFWVMDGRHKMEAYRRLIVSHKRYASIPIGVSIYDSDDIGFETSLFYSLNTASLPLSNGIKYRNIQNLGRHYGEEYLLDKFDLNFVLTYRAIELVDQMNKYDGSPFYDRIAFYGQDMNQKHLIRDVDLVPMYRSMLQRKVLGFNLDDLVFNLVTYWGVLRNMYLECYENSNRYALFGYPGVYVFNKLFLDVEKLVADNTEAGYRRILYKLNSNTEKHPQLVFRNPMEPIHWDVSVENNLFITRNPQILDFIYINLKNKLHL